MLTIILFIVIIFLIINFTNIEGIKDAYRRGGSKGVLKFMAAYTLHILTWWVSWFDK